MILICIQENQNRNEFKILIILQFLIPCKLNKTNVINLICFLAKILFMKLHLMKGRTINNKKMKVSKRKTNMDKS